MMDKQDLRNLKKRYLIWLYKTTKEALDKIERKFTQLEIDAFILKELKKSDKTNKCAKFIEEFDAYIQNKAKEGLQLKYKNNKGLKPDYLFLALKLKAIEKAVIAGFGKKFLQEINSFYEIEMTQRILKSTEH
jgi:hypothetical protein